MQRLKTGLGLQTEIISTNSLDVIVIRTYISGKKLNNFIAIFDSII